MLVWDVFGHPNFLIAFVLNQVMDSSRKKTQITAAASAADMNGVEEFDMESVTNIPNSTFYRKTDELNIETMDNQEGMIYTRTHIKTHTYTHAYTECPLKSQLIE